MTMFAETRDETRNFFHAVWRKMSTPEVLTPLETIVADVIKKHPEYHGYLDPTVHDSLDSKQSNDFTNMDNPFLHMGLHIALVEQLQSDRPKGVRRVYSQIIENLAAADASSLHEAEHAIMQCLSDSLWLASRNGQAPDENVYLENLKKLISKR
jgi:hypothetical protein